MKTQSELAELFQSSLFLVLCKRPCLLAVKILHGFKDSSPFPLLSSTHQQKPLFTVYRFEVMLRALVCWRHSAIFARQTAHVKARRGSIVDEDEHQCNAGSRQGGTWSISTQIFMGEVARLALQDASSAAANSLVTLACFKSCTNSLARCLG